MKENQHGTKRYLLVEKQKDLSDQKCIDLQPEKSLSGGGWCRTKQRVTELHGRQTESLFLCFAAGRLISFTGPGADPGEVKWVNFHPPPFF